MLLIAEFLFEQLILAVEFLNCRGGINRQRIGLNQQDLRAIGQPLPAAFHLVGKDLLELLRDHIRVAAVLDLRMCRKVIGGVAKIDQADLIDFFQGAVDRFDVGLDPAVGAGEPGRSCGFPGIPIHFQGVVGRRALDADIAGEDIVLIEAGDLCRGQVRAQCEGMPCTGSDRRHFGRRVGYGRHSVRFLTPNDGRAVGFEGHAEAIARGDLGHSAQITWHIALPGFIETPSHDRAVALEGKAVMGACRDGDDPCRGGSWHGDLPYRIPAPRHHRTRSREREVVILARGDGRDGDSREARWNRRLPPSIIAPCTHCAVRQKCQAVVFPRRNLGGGDDVTWHRGLAAGIAAPGDNRAVALAGKVVIHTRGDVRDAGGGSGHDGLVAGVETPCHDRARVQQRDAVGRASSNGGHAGQTWRRRLPIAIRAPSDHRFHGCRDDIGKQQL